MTNFPDELKNREVLQSDEAAVLRILGLDEKPEKQEHAPNSGVDPSTTSAYPVELDDLTRLYSLIRSRRVTTVLEFGSGFSTAVIASALEENRAEMQFLSDFQKLRRNNPFELHSLDCSASWLKETQKKIKDEARDLVHLHHSQVKIGTFNDRICHYYNYLPNICPDFIYLDGPWQYDVEGDIDGTHFRHNDRTVLAGDILRLEWTLLPGTLILVDGRTNNARFLKANFQRNWHHQHIVDGDVHLFELQEKPLGSLNRRQISFCLGEVEWAS